MTELKHGSNVAMLQTVAMLDVSADEWVITTPDEGAIKWCAPCLLASPAPLAPAPVGGRFMAARPECVWHERLLCAQLTQT